MNRLPLRGALWLASVLPLAAQVSVTDFFVFKGTVYSQTSDAPGDPPILPNPAPHAPGPYYIDVGVVGTGITSAPTFKQPPPLDATSTALTANTDSTRWDFKAGYSNLTALDLNYPNGAYKITIPGFNSGSEMTLTLTGNNYPSVVPKVINLGPGLSWNSDGKLTVDLNTATTLNFQAFTDYNTNHSGLEYRQLLAFVPPTGNYFGDLKKSAFNESPFTSYALNTHPLTAGTEYRVVLEYDVFTTRIEVPNPNPATNAEGGAIYSHQTQFYLVAIPEPSTCALLAGAAMLAGAIARKRIKTAA